MNQSVGSAEDHTILIRHHGDDVWEWRCACGEGGIQLPKVAKALIMAHRMEKIPRVREAMAR